MRFRLGWLFAGSVLLAQIAPQLSEPLPERKPTGPALTNLVLFAPNPSIELRDGLAAIGVATQKTEKDIVLVDGAAIVRRVFRVNATDRMILDDIKLWRRGQDVYVSYCQRCHGPDGKDTSYPGTRSLSGLGKGRTEVQLIEMSGRAGSVDMSAFTERDLKALGVFLAGL